MASGTVARIWSQLRIRTRSSLIEKCISSRRYLRLQGRQRQIVSNCSSFRLSPSFFVCHCKEEEEEEEKNRENRTNFQRPPASTDCTHCVVHEILYWLVSAYLLAVVVTARYICPANHLYSSSLSHYRCRVDGVCMRKELPPRASSALCDYCSSL